jgi:TonB family protein
MPDEAEAHFKKALALQPDFARARDGQGPATASRGGQTPQTNPPNPSTAPDYSKAAFIIESQRTVASFENDGTRTLETTLQVKVQSQAALQTFGLLTLGYNAANEQIEIGHVRVRKADGTVVETPATDVRDVTSAVTRLAPVFSDYREKQVPVKGLGVGDVLDYEFSLRAQTPLVPGQFWFQYDFLKTGVVLDEELEINVPKSRAIKVKSAGLEPTVREDGDRRIYSWKTANLEPKEAPKTEIPPPAVLVSTFASWEEVGQWWGALQRERVTATPELRAKATELIEHAKTDEDKVRAIYNYVATKFRYVSISFGIGRYQPHAASEVLQNGYGDCKDKHTLLASLLQAAGIEAYPALMNSARKIDPDVPSPGQFDHVISVVAERRPPNKLVFLDTTTGVAPFGFLTRNLRGQQALAIPTTGAALLVNTPAEPPFKNSYRLEMDGKLSDAGVLEAKMRISFRGDLELVMRTAFRQLPQSQWIDLVQKSLQSHPEFPAAISGVEVGDAEDTKDPYSLSFRFTEKDDRDWAQHRVRLPLGFVKLAELTQDSKQMEPILGGAPVLVTVVARLQVPKGYSPTPPPAIHVTRDFAEYQSSYNFKDGMLLAEADSELKHPVPPSALDDYRSFQKVVSEDADRYINFGNGSQSGLAPSPLATAEQAQPTGTPKRIRVGGQVEQAKWIFHPNPAYPSLAKMGRVQGTVRLEAIISKDGTIQDLKVISGHPLLVKSALDTVAQWKYQPTLFNGEPVEVLTEIDVNFMLSGEPGKGQPGAEASAAQATEGPAQKPVAPGGAVAQHDKAGENIGQANEVRPLDAANQDAQSNLSDELRRKGDLEGALLEARQAAELKPNDAVAHRALGSALRAQGDVDAAIAEYRKALSLNPDYAQAHSGLGNALQQKHDVNGAILEYLEALRLMPDDASTRHGLGDALRAKGDLDKAIVQFRAAVQLAPDNPNAHHSLGLALYDRHDYPGAVREFRDAVALDPQHKWAWNDLGRAYLALGQLDEAIDAFNKQIKVSPRDQYAYNNLGLVLWQQRKYEGAITAFRKQLEIGPDDRYAHANLGRLYAEREQYPDAVVELEKAIAITPNDAIILASLSRAYLKLGKAEKSKVLDEKLASQNAPSAFSAEGPVILSDTQGVDFGPYLARAVFIVRRNWYALIPEAARQGRQGRVSVVFEILKDGSVSQIRLTQNSGNDSLDNATSAAIQTSAPFPPLPQEFAGKHLVLQLTFLYNEGTRTPTKLAELASPPNPPAGPNFGPGNGSGQVQARAAQ